MHRERMAADAQSIMREQGLDALVLLGNTNVVYATGAIWPLADSGRANFEQPVAVVLADDEWPHLFSPIRDDDRLRAMLPADHLHGPVYLDFDEGVELFASQLAGLRARGRIRRDRRVDQRAAARADAPRSPRDARVDGGRVISRPRPPRRRTSSACMRKGCASPSRPSPRCRRSSRPGVARPT